MSKECSVSHLQFRVNFQNGMKKNRSKFYDQFVDAMLRYPNTSPNTEAVVHRYSIKQLF